MSMCVYCGQDGADADDGYNVLPVNSHQSCLDVFDSMHVHEQKQVAEATERLNQIQQSAS